MLIHLPLLLFVYIEIRADKAKLSRLPKYCEGGIFLFYFRRFQKMYGTLAWKMRNFTPKSTALLVRKFGCLPTRFQKSFRVMRYSLFEVFEKRFITAVIAYIWFCENGYDYNDQGGNRRNDSLARNEVSSINHEIIRFSLCKVLFFEYMLLYQNMCVSSSYPLRFCLKNNDESGILNAFIRCIYRRSKHEKKNVWSGKSFATKS